jgi:3-dehydroquinate dehydratase I
MSREISLGKIDLGKVPRVAGIISSAEFLFKLPSLANTISCDLLEIRLDEIDLPWPEVREAIQKTGVPVLLTIRHPSEGGKWRGSEQERLAIYLEALHDVAIIDVELNSEIAEQVTKAARDKCKPAIVSFHDFAKTPSLDELNKIISRGQKIADVVKISTMVRGAGDIAILEELLRMDREAPLCVIGMGDHARQTRVTFPLLGSCLTYGYLDKPTAPGQWSAAELVEELKKRLSAD